MTLLTHLTLFPIKPLTHTRARDTDNLRTRQMCQSSVSAVIFGRNPYLSPIAIGDLSR
jgi:hypothetical protein